MESLLLMSGKAQVAEPVLTDNAVAPLSMTPEGHVRVASKPFKFTSITGALTTVAQTLIANVVDASNVMLHVKNTGSATMAAGTFIFEGSLDSTDGTNGTWFAIQAVRSDSNTIENSVAALGLVTGTATAYSWELSVNAVKYFRVRCSVTTTASSIATWTIARGTYATEPIPAIQPHAVSGTVGISGTVPVSGTVAVSGTIPVSGTVALSGTSPVSGSVSITGTPAVTSTATPTNGTTYNVVTAATTNAANIKAGAGNLYELSCFNSTAATIYIRLYNKASSPTVGTDVPVMVIPVGVGISAAVNFGILGKRFATGISIAVTAAAANNDATVVTVGALINATFL